VIFKNIKDLFFKKKKYAESATKRKRLKKINETEKYLGMGIIRIRKKVGNFFSYSFITKEQLNVATPDFQYVKPE